MDLVRICDGLFPLPVEEKVIMGTWRALAIPFPPCLSRKRQSWEHGVRLRVPFLLARRGKGRPGVPAIHFFPVRSLDQGSLLVYYGALPLPRVSPRLKLFFYARSVFLDREREKTILAEI